MRKEVQYTRSRESIYLCLVILTAAFLQLYKIFDISRDTLLTNLGILDCYLFSCRGSLFFENLICWFIPLLCGVFGGDQFAYFTRISETLFVRVNREKFVRKRVILSIARSISYILVFYLAAFAVNCIVMKLESPDMFFGVSYFRNAGLLNEGIYFSKPVLYLGIYVLLACIFSAVFSLSGFLLSYWMSNKVFIRVIPFLFMLVITFVTSSMPAMKLMNYNNMMLLDPGFTDSFSPVQRILCSYGTSIGLIAVLLILVSWSVRKHSV